MVGTATSPAEAAHLKSTLHVECCTDQPAALPRTVGQTLTIF